MQEFAKFELKRGLSRCTNEEQLMFKRMYSHGNLERDINDVVDRMDIGKLDLAMEQVGRTIQKKL